ncbi:type I secretion system permease/ATPase [Pseudomonas aeruginosa]|uniref:type I secretion system permease/ATPase n=1 Tax=Pseudomonas aeruginosa TaxID=287 RepID=UPI00071B4401|nr:type I secretion system permease/ATPase [Pseudomonas aeruginosa]ALU49026.1 peptidase [Pseudomonas aeruginosa]KSD38962.1 type I secretion system permease/ATPase [Pseudomonas aeruginosa]MBI8353560.1 type I secretion system permease/ATPase [Pseudomonas aeruginosa]MEC6382653.1 type I secretion system permease/ATPase [Pseudomonas aeruginosa]MWW53455.1 type I secretion system permease/ATPase [Pseudomonas aeruginosa]
MKLRPASPRNEILATLGRFRPALRSVALFTAVINLLMLAPSLYMLQVYDRVLGSGNHMTLLMLTLMVLGLYLLLGALEWVRSLVVIRLGGQLDMQLNQRIYDASFRASLERGEQAVGQALNDLTSLRQFLTGNALFAFFDAPWFPLYLLVIFLFSPWLGLLALVGALLLVLLAWVNESRSREPLAEAGQLSILATQQASANLRQAETLAAMGMLPAMRARWFAQHQAFLARQNLGSERSAAIGATSKGVRLALQSLVLGLGAWLAVEGLITPGMMIAGSILMGRVLSPIDQLIAVWRQWSGARQAYQRLARLLEENPPAALGMPLPAPRGALRVERLCAAAPGREQALLQDLGFALEPGEALGVIGPSGSGKSTLARLLVGAWQPLSGAVRLDGADLRQWSAAALGPHIGYLAQDVQLFAGSIAENIARFAEVDAEKVVAAARLAGVHDLVLRLPQGYDTRLGDGGAGLSGGQRQRIGLARALYGRPALIVLDEPNASLDEAGETALAEAIAAMRRHGSSLVLVTHKPAVLALTDKLLLLHGGRLQRFGATAEVLASASPPAAAAPAPTRPTPAFGFGYRPGPGMPVGGVPGGAAR